MPKNQSKYGLPTMKKSLDQLDEVTFVLIFLFLLPILSVIIASFITMALLSDESLTKIALVCLEVLGIVSPAFIVPFFCWLVLSKLDWDGY
jgi:uncharacterized SAM-binding protein YcdF (DUF218 family)